LCRSEVLLIFKHHQPHVMINGDAHTFRGDNSSFYSPLQFEYYNSARSTATTMVVGSPGEGELDDDFLPRWKRNTWVCPATLLVGGGGDGATVARQEAAPRRLSG
jgi:hypothetical protein